MKLDRYRIDPKKAKSGAWIDLPTFPGTKLLIARINNSAYMSELERLKAPYKQAKRVGALDEGEIPEEARYRIMGQAMAKHVLLSWKGLELEGQDFPYSPANAERLLCSEEFQEFRDMVLLLSTNLDNFRMEHAAETGKDSAPTSDGT